MGLVLEVIEGPHSGANFAFDQHDTFLVGRSKTAHLSLPEDSHLSRHQFLLEFNPPSCYLRDLSSRNGTFVNGAQVKESYLRDNDEIHVGRTKIRFRVEVPLELPKTISVSCMACRTTTIEQPATRSNPSPTMHLCDSCKTVIKGQPQPVPGYELVRKLGQGGMGAVYLVHQIATSQSAALKLIVPESAASERAVQMFLREVSVLSQLHHPRIVRFREMGTCRGQFYFVMDYVESAPLDEIRAKLSPANDVKAASGIICQVLDALAYAHEKSFVHRDIKPSNILVSRAGRKLRTKLADFGLAKNFENGGFSGMTRSGEVRGSLAYMAPEQVIDCRAAKPAVDIYSVGATLYALLAKSAPRDFSSRKDPFAIILEDEIPPLQERCPHLPAGLAAVVHRAIARRPEDRFTSAKDMRTALLPYAKGAPS